MSDYQQTDKARVILGPLAKDLPFMVRNLHSMLRSVGASIRGPLNLESGSIGILSLIWVNPGISQNDLAENLAMKKSAVAKLVKSLEAQGCLARERLPGDRRMNAITLTSKGHAMIASIRQLSAPLNDEMVEGFSEDDLEAFFRVLEKLHNRLSERVSISPSSQDD